MIARKRLSVLVAVHGRGRGHGTRASVVVDALRTEGHRVLVMAGGSAIELFATDADLHRVESVLPGPKLVRRMGRRVAEDFTLLRALRPDVVITDGDAPVSLVASWLRIPIIAIGHGLVFAHCDCGPLPVLPHVREALNALSASLTADARVAVHFASARPRAPSTRVARADVRPSLDRARPVSNHVVAYFRDDGVSGVGSDARDASDAWLEDLARRGEHVIAFANRRNAPSGVTRRPLDADAFAEALATAKGAVGTAGSNLIAECAHLGIPLLALAAENDVEQRLNGRILEQAGIGVAATLGDFDSARVSRFVRSCSRVSAEGRRGDLLPNAPGVAGAVLDALRDVVPAFAPPAH